MRQLWLLFFVGLVGGTYGFLHQPRTPGSVPGRGFAWSALWGKEEDRLPSERLTPYVTDFLNELTSPLGSEIDNHLTPNDLVELRHLFHAEAEEAPARLTDVYDTAVQTCNALLLTMESRAKALAALQSVRQNRQPDRDPLPQRGALNRNYLEQRVRAGWLAEAARDRQVVEQWYAVLKRTEQSARRRP